MDVGEVDAASGSATLNDEQKEEKKIKEQDEESVIEEEYGASKIASDACENALNAVLTALKEKQEGANLICKIR